MAFPPHFLDELRARVGLADVIGRRVRLVRKGREFLGLCPFHNEKTPSFTVNEQKGFYHCFGCGAHGSLFDYVMQAENLGFRDAVERLAAEAGLQVPVETPEEAAKERKRQSLYEVVDAAAAYYRDMLRAPGGEPARAYLRGRGVDDGAIAAFDLGYAPDSRFGLRAALSRDGIDEDLMVEAGLLIAPEDGGRAPYDRFRGRLMFPIGDRNGRTVGFGGRVLGGGEPKYLNSPETPLYQKGRLLYGLAQARKAALARKTLIVVEGYMDVIALSRAGFENAVAPLGTALTEDQIRELWRVADEPVLCFDGDAAGVRAAARAAERVLPLLRPGYGLRFASLPEGEDPDSLIVRDGTETLARLLDASMPLSAFLWRSTVSARRTQTPEERAELWKVLRDLAQKIADPDIRREFRETFYRSLWPEQGKAGLKSRRRLMELTPVAADAVAPASIKPCHDAEKTILAIIVNHPRFFHEIEEEMGSIGFTDGTLDRLRQELILALSGSPDLDAAGVKSELRGRGLSGALDGLLDDPVIRIHRVAGPTVSSDELRAKWGEAMKALRMKAAEAEREPASDGDTYSEERMKRRVELKRASLNDDRD